jgi:N-methylhydantoinase A
MADVRVAADVGGTFTDIYVLDGDGAEVRVAKVPTSPDPIEGVLEGLRAAGVDVASMALFCHGSTVATNALITRRLPPAAMVTTKGFRDVIEIRRSTKEDLWDAYSDVAPPYIRRRDRLEVRERIDAAGREVEPLDEAEARRVAAVLRKKAVKTVAVCFINSYANPQHERRMREILEEELEGVSVSVSSDVLPEIFEHERFSTTVANAVLAPLVGSYANRLAGLLERDGYRGEVLLLHSGGGVMTPRMAERYPVRLAASGIAAGAIAGQRLAVACGYRNAIGLDMGGTSTDISLVHDGVLQTTNEWHVEYGYPIRFPSIEVLTIGAGGGSVAWIDEAGSLRNGPQSAGADPGPACYGRGSREPTNTDANLVLGRLGDRLVGGTMRLDVGAARAAIDEGVGRPLGMSTTEAAHAVLQVANANMANAVRLISIRRGYDPREFALVVFGGAGPLHGAALARELSIPVVLVPPNPGITSAFGCLLVDVRHDFSTMYLAPAAQADVGEIEREFVRLEAEAEERLRLERVPRDRMSFQRWVSMRYLGQWRSLPVPVGRPLGSMAEAVARFHAEHELQHNYRRDEASVEIYGLSLTAVGETVKPELRRVEPNGATPPAAGSRQVWFDGEPAPLSTPVYRREQLGAGARLEGPAVVEQLDSTVLIPPGVDAAVDEWLNIRMQVLQET